ncbi:2-dehydro-3-deoxygalactonokinase [Methylobacterium oryzihabitans]|uniref:2-dehydro-3-deoxygalactonokinase n=1 Tax=Methylobacterium oryzihabitans TaxID=2499852 RepID=A0A3S2V8Q0_9HYPH|nr:2-dehydro-3-deoxygalactonokinase [Methylobacterium oryzihabitans]RVU16608.1 2-dehydro-3-deoxygalactonokinase [Methylobacterium oryzihabitans]
MIGIDWGTSSARAYRLDPDGTVRERREGAGGILHVAPGGFPDALRAMAGDWIAAGERRILLSGMVGSRQGWQEAPYLPCPAGLGDLALGVVPIPFEGAELRLVPGLSAHDAAGIPEVMRGEEVQVFGGLDGAQDALVCLPGSHAKWVRVEGGRIAGFTTSLTGEAFAALRGHTILARMIEGEAAPGAAFDDGVARARDPGGLLHHLFGARALALFGRLAPADGAGYLSGLLIGHEVAASLPPGAGPVHLVGSGPLMALYGRAIALAGAEAVAGDADAAAKGLARIGERIAWA